MGERTDEVRGYASSEPERYLPSYQGVPVENLGETFKPDYSLSEVTIDDTSDVSDDERVDAETEAIREDIEQTRTEMARTVDEIQARLNPETIVEHVKEAAKETANNALDNVKQTVHDATIGKVENMVNNVSESARETSSGLMGIIKENPIPSALVGLGLGWLYMKRQNNSASNQQVQPVYAAPTGYVSSYPYVPAAVPAPVVYPTTYRSNTNSGGNGIVDKIMQNPVPAALAGASIGYILMKGQGNSSSPSPSYTGSSHSSQGSQPGLGDKVGNVVGQAGSKVGDIASSAGDVVGKAGEKAGDIASGTAEAVGNVASGTAGLVGDVASGAAGVVGNVASGAAEAVGNIASGAGDVAGNVVGGVQQGAGKATSQLERMLQENPLVVGGAALVLGAMIGMMLPATEKENQILGKAHDTVMEKAGEAVQETFQKVSSVAEEVTNTVKDTVKEEAKNQGLTQ